jgi:hypothetical protein
MTALARGKDSIGMRWTACMKRGFIHDPVGKAKSVIFTEEGLERSLQLLEELFGKAD